MLYCRDFEVLILLTKYFSHVTACAQPTGFRDIGVFTNCNLSVSPYYLRQGTFVLGNCLTQECEMMFAQHCRDRLDVCSSNFALFTYEKYSYNRHCV